MVRALDQCLTWTCREHLNASRRRRVAHVTYKVAITIGALVVTKSLRYYDRVSSIQIRTTILDTLDIIYVWYML